MALMAASFMNKNLADHNRHVARHHHHKKHERKRAGSDVLLPLPNKQHPQSTQHHLTVPINNPKLKHKRSISQPDITKQNELRGKHRNSHHHDGEESPTPPPEHHHHHKRDRVNSDCRLTTPEPAHLRGRRTSDDSSYGQHAQMMVVRKRSLSITPDATHNRNPFGKLWRQMQRMKLNRQSTDDDK